MEQKLLQIILNNTFTKADLYERLAILRRFLEAEYFEQKEEAGRRKRMEMEEAMKAWGDEFYGSFNRDNAYRLLEKIHQLIEELPVVTLYLPVDLPKEEVPKLGRWFRDNVDRQALADLRFDPRLVGGLALVWKGVYRDFSLRFYLEKNKERIMEVISGYGGM